MNCLMQNHPLTNRIIKRQKHLQKWAKRNQITCYRIYERDLPEYPLILDWYDGFAVMWLYERTKDDTDSLKSAFITEVITSVCQALEIVPAQLIIKHRQKQKGLQNQYDKIAALDRSRVIEEAGLKFKINLYDYLDTGLFLDHRKTRGLVRSMAKGKRFLNLFAYTGSFTCYAIAGGAASSTTVDLNPNYSEWTLANLRLNGFQNLEKHQVITEDCLTFLNAHNEKNKYDLIVCDPPTFSNSKRQVKKTFCVDEDYVQLITACTRLLSPGGDLIFSTNSRKFKLDQALLPSQLSIQEITSKTVPEDFRNKTIHRCWHFRLQG